MKGKRTYIYICEDTGMPVRAHTDTWVAEKTVTPAKFSYEH